MAQSFKLMSFNIQFGTDYAKVPNLPKTIDTIAAADPDIVALQEVDKHWSKRSGFADQVRILSEALGMHAAYGANLDLEPPEPGAPRRQYGTAVLSKYEIVGNRNYPLSSFGYEQRGLLETEIDINGTRLGCYCIHMGLTPDQRLVQAKEALAIIRRREGPLVLAGDFNAAPDSPELHLLLDGGMADCFAGLPDVLTFPSDAPTDRIDYILHSGRLVKLQAAVLESTTSDHRPILAGFAVK
ncbi:endonuclease [Paenibacillus mesophilus]|uniref:endonuclease/exonuclease/phosphatase family protein n=1 Tax=Paenibacillus mesophilus TaxID=2582849 RepID=UPI00110E4072|nr:endonuclease/exonuclease/phosphatase family protein [Paenibacillus mesophilus]TMV46064.1 endonuclease [Paenibacillus mesophilus]